MDRALLRPAPAADRRQAVEEAQEDRGMSDPDSPMTASGRQGVTVVVGSRVRVRDAEGEHEHTLVAHVTARTPLTCVSAGSPVGRALLGRRSGDQVQVHTPDGVRVLTIVSVAADTPPAPSSPPPCRG
jgi:transcription elongation factor GreA